MSSKTKSFFKKLLSSVLSAACLVSGTAVMSTAIGSAVSDANIKANAAAPNNPPAFSWDNATVYFLLTDRFCNGNTLNDHSYGRGLDKNGNLVNDYKTEAAFQGGDFAGITQKINEGYFDDLGVNAIWLSAPYEQIHGYVVGGSGNPSYPHFAYHGYYVLDYTETDKNFGTEEEFKTLVDTAHKHGIRIVMDVVMNHTGYNDLKTMNEYDFGSASAGWDDYYYTYKNTNNSTYHSFIDYQTESVWAKWWGPDWVRSGLPGYTSGSGDVEGSLSGLPDFKTESTTPVGIPPVLQTKWTQEGTYNEKAEKYGETGTVRSYLVKWLTEWVEKYGVDGFRCDTAKHVEIASWQALKAAGVEALNTWRENNPTAPGADWTDDFWMTGESWGHTVSKSNYFTSGAFDSMINFEFAPGTETSDIPLASNVESIYSRYAGSINSDSSFNVLSYLASHDTTLIESDRIYAGSFLMMLPGGIQIYYGDETGRPYADVSSDSSAGDGHMLRGFMNWDAIDEDILSHWSKLGQFRNNHLAVGAGTHNVISAYNNSTGYTFSRTYQNDKVVATLFAPANTDITVNVSGVFEDGIEVENFYDDTTSTVSNGKVTFNSGENGTILIQTPIEEKGRVIVRHINADDETVWATETVSGNIGESYTINPLAAYGYTLSYVEGSETGTFSEEDAEVDFYYTFDSVNYAHLTVNHVDASTGNEIAEPEKSVIEIGTSYNASPKTITNYEVDLTNSDSPTGKAVQGTNTVTFRYNYVEPVCLKVHYYNANGWSNVYMYAYTGDGPTAVQLIGQWPGTAMTSEGNNWYVCTVPDVESAKVLFTASVYGPQEPGNQQPGYELSGEVWVKNGKVQTASKVNVLYVTTDGETLASETLSGLSGETYATEAKTFDNYELTGTPDNASGTFGSETITVTYTYTATTPQPEPLINTSTLSDESIELGESFTVNASAQGGTAPYQYSVLYKLNKRSKWTTAQAYSDNNKIDILPEAVGTYDVCVKVRDESSTEAKNFYTITVTEKDFENTSTVSSESVVKGDTVTFTCSTSDTSGSYKYALYRMGAEDDEFVLVNDFAAVNSINAVMSEGGIYQFRVDAKSIGGTISSKVFEIRVMMPIYDVLTNTSTLSSDNIKAGESITVNASAQGGTAPYQYTVLYKLGTRSKWTTAQAYSENDTIIITPADSGQYDLCIKVKDATGKEEKLFPTITVTGGLVNTSTLPEKVSLGDTVTVNASAKGGTAPYQYAVLYKLKSRSKWTTAQAYGTNSTVNFTPAVDGAYDVCVKVKDAEGTEEKLFFDLTVEDSFRNTSTLSASSITAGSSVTVICQADGSGDTYLYYVSCKKTTDEGWTVLQSFSENSNVVFTPASSGSYSIYVEASDANGDMSVSFSNSK